MEVLLTGSISNDFTEYIVSLSTSEINENMEKSLAAHICSQSKKGGKDQASIQSSTTHDPDTTWESDKNINITNKSQEVSPFPAGDHKAAMNRCESMKNASYK